MRKRIRRPQRRGGRTSAWFCYAWNDGRLDIDGPHYDEYEAQEFALNKMGEHAKVILLNTIDLSRATRAIKSFELHGDYELNECRRNARHNFS